LWIALLALWATRADAFLVLQDSMVFIFSGMIAPVAFLPELFQKIALILPLRFLDGFPVEILTANLTTQQIQLGFLIQIVWLSASILSWVVWSNGIGHSSAIGG
jgi:ABC-2 type transport system permease protein